MPRTIFKNIVIQHFERTTFFEFCQYTSIRFFEIIYIKKGSGTLKINGKEVTYRSNSFFIFIPNDAYIIEVEEPTTITTIKFLKTFFNDIERKTSDNLVNNWLRKIEIILNNENRKFGEFQFTKDTDAENLELLMGIICNERKNNWVHDEVIIKNTLSTILHLIARNTTEVIDLEVDNPKKSIIQDIVNYIHQHIYEPDFLTIKSLSGEFNIAENYIGQYFKKQMDISLKKYILNYKIQLAETRLKYTDLHASEIAIELGFTDSSHLNKTFIAYKGLSISEFKETF